MRVSKALVLLVDSERGESGVLPSGLRLMLPRAAPAGHRVAGWLAGGPHQDAGTAEAGHLSEIRKEMAALQAEVSISMMRSGMLIGVLNLNGRITGRRC